MNSQLLYLSLLIILFCLELIYFKIATKYQITDKPNSRSSHSDVVLRGGGILFPIAMVVHCLYFGISNPYFMIGLLMISSISFYDDLKPASKKVRISVHLAAVSLLSYQLSVFTQSTLIIIFSVVIVIGIINAVNFMDGINGITGAYAFVTLASLLFINVYIQRGFTDSRLIITALLAVTVFNYFNFRKKARCFAGDVGSVSMAFILIFFIGQLIVFSDSFNYLLLLFVYGLDTVTTIIFRLVRGENILEAHRSHFFQFLSNECKFPHLYVASGYALTQLVFNAFLTFFLGNNEILLIGSVLVFGALFLILRFACEGADRLLKPTK